ncbi:hypothetical protein TWF788_007886 [Orbilia oligospora]|uniref:Uncharacterized protein n=1 Tax=Orbilia oligospora TaxID=2813651 RepID=A0A7C8TVQ7_ORBOL|nr:hypothetical protein TWF788_007886 [Orbilia oligospora]
MAFVFSSTVRVHPTSHFKLAGGHCNSQSLGPLLVGMHLDAHRGTCTPYADNDQTPEIPILSSRVFLSLASHVRQGDLQDTAVSGHRAPVLIKACSPSRCSIGCRGWEQS